MIKNKYTQKIFIWVYLFEGWGNPGNTPAWQKSHNQTKKPNPNFSQYFTLRWIPGTSSATIKSIIQTKKLGISKGILLKADKTKIYLFLQSLYFLSVLSLILLIRCWDGMRCKGEREPAVCMYSLLYQFPLCLLSGTLSRQRGNRSHMEQKPEVALPAWRGDGHTDSPYGTMRRWGREQWVGGPGWRQAIGTAQPRGSQETAERAPWKHKRPRQIMATGN